MKLHTSITAAFAGFAALLVSVPIGAETLNEDDSLKGSYVGQGDNFGIGLALDGDTAAVGAFAHTWAGFNYEGAVFVFTRDANGKWNKKPLKLVQDDPSTGDNLGISVALDEDRGTIVAGAYDKAFNPVPTSGRINQAGAAYVFKRDGGQWTQQQKLLAPTPTAYERFGAAVAIDGDFVAIGALGQDRYVRKGADNDRGSVYVFRRTDVNGTELWKPEGKLVAADAELHDRFGRAIDIDGDTIMVGAYGDDNQGSVYVFKRDFDQATSAWIWTEHSKLTTSGPENGQAFGISVALQGNTAIIGAHGDSSQGPNTGAAYVFKHDNGVWSEYQKLTALCGSARDSFGYRVALDDGVALVSAHGHAGDRIGLAYVFVEKCQGKWIEAGELAGTGVTNNTRFATRMALSGQAALVWHQDSVTGEVYSFTLTEPVNCGRRTP